ncbi:unnamed protein product [Parnassius mnemosyne]|uniref:Zinc finger protein n=1 Tax=Parnassius mnemosyne TaxID=213953 RepID=A0AAV1LMW9_9NEOP
MNNICRFCLSEDSIMDVTLTECDFFLKITLCFGHDIVTGDSLPQTICTFCKNKIEDIYIFRNKIIQNQNILLSRLKEVYNTVNNFNKNDKEHINRENNENEFDNKENEVLQDGTVKIKYEQSKVIAESGINSLNKSELSEIEDGYDFCSEDNVSHSLIKQSKNPDKHSKSPASRTSPKDQTGIYTGNNLTCLTCFKKNSTQIELLKHYNDEHTNSKLTQEDKSNSGDKNYEIVTGSNGCNKYKCKKCERVFDSKRKMNKHTISHVEDRPFLCKLCGRTYKTASEIVRHGRAHNGTRIPCSYQCGYSTVYLGALKQHERRHRTEYSYTCDKCGKGFQVLTWYEQHQNVHTGAKPFVCEICGVAFHMDRYLKAHITTVHPQASTRKRFLCVHCSKPCDSKKGLTLHLKEHGITTTFLCDICGKVLSDAGQLKFHKRIHLGERPYSCSTCSKSFTKRFNLKLHARTHTGERAHTCTVCGKRYTQRATLHRHVDRYVVTVTAHKGQYVK